MTHGPYTKAKQRYLIAERDRLRSLNDELLEALKAIAKRAAHLDDRIISDSAADDQISELWALAHAAIASASLPTSPETLDSE